MSGLKSSPLLVGEGPGVRFLIEELPINYLSSASLLKTLREAQARRKATAPYPLLAFAHPAYQPTPAPSQADSGLTGNTPPYPPSRGESKGGVPQQGNVSFQELRRQAYRDFCGGDFPELPETAEEARVIAAILQAPAESEPLQLRAQASRANVFAFNRRDRLDKYHYLVFAMHGVLPGDVNNLNQPGSGALRRFPDHGGCLRPATQHKIGRAVGL